MPSTRKRIDGAKIHIFLKMTKKMGIFLQNARFLFVLIISLRSLDDHHLAVDDVEAGTRSLEAAALEVVDLARR